MIWIIAGTSEGREIITRIEDLDNFIATIATDGGKEFIPTDKLIVGRMTYDEMVDFSIEHNISAVVDLTHPYAKIVSENAKRLSKELDIRYIRYVRDKINSLSNAICLDSYEEACKYLSNISATVFFTTGSKNIEDFEKVKGSNRFIYRVLPAVDSIKECIKHNISMKDTVAVLGPFSTKYNKIMLEEYKADYCIMKNSGEQGGTMEKIKACEELGIIPIVIGREYEEGINDLDLIEKIIREEGKEGKQMGNSHRFYKNIDCDYFPCHKVENTDEFNCMFCYCPLYLLENCEGNYMDNQGIKDCSNCLIPHRPKGYDYINKKIVYRNNGIRNKK